MSTPVTTYDKRPVIVSPTAPTSLEQLRYLWLDISETTSVLRYYNATTETWEAINDVDTSSFLTTNGVQTITGAKTFNTGTITVADITVDDVTIEGIDTIKLTDGDTHIPTSKLVEDTLASAISGLETSIEGELATKQNTLNYYSETPGDTPSATISVTNIKLDGKVAEGTSTTASGLASHAEGWYTIASGQYSHAEGQSTTASNYGSHAEGTNTTASGQYSHAEGRSTTAKGDYQHAQGKYNIEDANDKYADIIGNGTSSSARSNAATVSWEGITWSKTDVRAGGTDQDAAAHSLAAKQNATDNTLETTDKTIVGAINELSADKQDTLQFYTESITDAPGYPSGSGIYQEQISLGKSNYSQTINIGGNNGSQMINLGGSVASAGIITIGTTGTGNNNQIQIGRDNTNTTLEINAVEVNGTVIDKTALTESSNKLPTSQAVLNGLSAKQNATDNSLTTTDKTIVGAINELSADKQNTLKYYSESDSSPSDPSINNTQVSISTGSGYVGTLNLGTGSGNYAQTINIGSSASYRAINISTELGGDNNVTIGNASDGVLLTLNTGRGLAGTGVTKDLSTSATDAQFPTAAAVKAVTDSKQNATDNTLTTTAKTISGAINEIENKVLDSHLSKLSAGALYFNSGKLSGSNFAVPTFPFSICATVRVDAWRSASEHSQPIFQYGELRSGTGSTCSIGFIDGENKPKLRLIITDTIDGASKTTEVNCALDLSTFLGKMHTIIGICRAVTAEALNWDIYIDGVKQNITSSLKNVVVSSLSGTRTWAVNTSNYNFSGQPASANPMILRNLNIFNFDVSAEGSPYSIADYEAGRLIPPALKPSQVSLALENYTIARNATTTLVKDASGNSNDATVKVSSGGYVAGDNDQSIKVFVDEIKTQINQSNG